MLAYFEILCYLLLGIVIHLTCIRNHFQLMWPLRDAELDCPWSIRFRESDKNRFFTTFSLQMKSPHIDNHKMYAGKCIYSILYDRFFQLLCFLYLSRGINGHMSNINQHHMVENPGCCFISSSLTVFILIPQILLFL